jgi:shikimate kinase
VSNPALDLAPTNFNFVSLSAPLVVLTGPPGVGKTTVGEALAERLSYQFYDSDALIQEAAGMSIPFIFECYGEAAFRKLEAKLVTDIAAKLQHFDSSRGGGTVLSTGAGLVIQSDNLDKLKAVGKVIYLTAPISVLLNRLRSQGDRPLLQVTDNDEVVKRKAAENAIEDEPLRVKLSSLLEKRQPIYSRSQYTVEVGDLPVPGVVDSLIALVT